MDENIGRLAAHAILAEKLAIAMEALIRIKHSDPGPAYYVAKGALEAIEQFDKECHGRS